MNTLDALTAMAQTMIIKLFPTIDELILLMTIAAPEGPKRKGYRNCQNNFISLFGLSSPQN